MSAINGGKNFPGVIDLVVALSKYMTMSHIEKINRVVISHKIKETFPPLS